MTSIQNNSSIPYSAVVAPAPSDRNLDRTSFLAEAPADSKSAEESPGPKAVAGDDVLAYAGRRATLNGGMSQPAGRIGLRWIQISGPQIQEAFAQGPNLVVVPPEPGVYQFLLVVAEGGQISEPDSVILTAVAHPEDEARRKAAMTAPPVQPSVSETSPAHQPRPTNRELFARLASAAVAKLPHREETVKELAEVFADVAAKMSLYGSYAEAQQELSRRITAAIDGDTADAATWNRQVFEPLTAALSAWVAPTGMDPGNARLWTLPLTEPSRTRLADGLKLIADGFRDAGVEPVADGNRGGQRR
ncbi:hypothetical protein GC170_04315 [bacterium]|nr:hypothetical protein [bacterium]